MFIYYYYYYLLANVCPTPSFMNVYTNTVLIISRQNDVTKTPMSI